MKSLSTAKQFKSFWAICSTELQPLNLQVVSSRVTGNFMGSINCKVEYPSLHLSWLYSKLQFYSCCLTSWNAWEAHWVLSKWSCEASLSQVNQISFSFIYLNSHFIIVPQIRFVFNWKSAHIFLFSLLTFY